MAFRQYVWLTCDTRYTNGLRCETKFDSTTYDDGHSTIRSPVDNRRRAAQLGWTHSRKFGDRCPTCSTKIKVIRQWNEGKR